LRIDARLGILERDILVCKAIIYADLALQIFFCSLFQCHWTKVVYLWMGKNCHL
jgi:hypothetical protein